MVSPVILKRQCASAVLDWCSGNTADARSQNSETRASLFRELLGLREYQIQQISELKLSSIAAKKGDLLYSSFRFSDSRFGVMRLWAMPSARCTCLRSNPGMVLPQQSAGIRGKLPIGADKSHRLNFGLGDEHSIEWICMVLWQNCHVKCMLKIDRQHLNLVRCSPPCNVLI